MIRTSAALLVVAAVLPRGAAGQVPDSAAAAPDSAAVRDSLQTEPAALQDTVARGPTPRGALFRSFVLPGWGQAQYDAYFRGSIYFAGWAGNWFMNFQNAARLGNARDMLGVRRAQVREELIQSSPNPDSMAAAMESDPTILQDALSNDEKGSELQGLVRSREKQREDWIAWSIFWVLASGVDAYVTGHLSDFPAAVEISPNQDQSVTLRLQVPFPGPPKQR